MTTTTTTTKGNNSLEDLRYNITHTDSLSELQEFINTVVSDVFWENAQTSKLKQVLFLPQKFCGNPAGVSRKNFVNLMGLSTFYLDS